MAEAPPRMRYKADITAGSLKVHESRIIADLMLRGVNAKDADDGFLYPHLLLGGAVYTKK